MAAEPMRYLVVVPADSTPSPGMTILPAPVGAVTVVGDGACIDEARMVVVDFPGAKIWDRCRLQVVYASAAMRPTSDRAVAGSGAALPGQVACEAPTRRS